MQKDFETQYLETLAYLLNEGKEKGDRTNTGTLSTFGVMIRHDLSKGFPLLTTKKVHFKSIVHELLWFLKGSTNIKYLQENGVSIWNDWANENGDLGRVYGAQWCNWRVYVNYEYMPPEEVGVFRTAHGKKTCYNANEVGYYYEVNQIAEVIEEIKSNPNSRRLLVSAWNVSDLPTMALAPCHYAFQFYVVNNKLSCLFSMRSVDFFLGFCFNIASYALLTCMVAQVCGLEVGEIVFSGADVHLYKNHIEQAKEQLTRIPFGLPTLELNKEVKNIFDFKFEDITLKDYISHSPIKAPVAV